MQNCYREDTPTRLRVCAPHTMPVDPCAIDMCPSARRTAAKMLAPYVPPLVPFATRAHSASITASLQSTVNVPSYRCARHQSLPNGRPARSTGARAAALSGHGGGHGVAGCAAMSRSIAAAHTGPGGTGGPSGRACCLRAGHFASTNNAHITSAASARTLADAGRRARDGAALLILRVRRCARS